MSGLMHELAARVATGRETGHQTLYFVASGLGVLASPAPGGLGGSGVIGRIRERVIAITFPAATAGQMFATLDKVIPLYAQPPPIDW